MNSVVESNIQTSEIIQIPSLLTNSYRAVVEEFGDSIISLTASGSTTTPNRSHIDELRQYGVIQEQETNHRVEIDYSTLSTEPDAGASNPLDEDARAAIDEYITATLDTEDLNVQPDLSVTQVTIRVNCEPLQEITAAQGPEFDICFVADPAEDAVREETQRLNRDRGLYSELGFNVKNLNIRSVVETATEYSEQSNWQCLSWEGPEDIQPRTDKRLAIRINEHILPDEYGMLKPYSVEDNQILDVVPEEFAQLDDENLEEGVEE